MSEKYKPQVGDRVRVVLEEEVAYVSEAYGYITLSRHDGDIEPVGQGGTVSIEKIEPPVETFGPGSVVRSISDPSATYAVTKDGFVALATGTVYKDSGQFTSVDYERIVL